MLEPLIADGAGGFGSAFTRMFELAMRLERERYLGAGHYERSDDRRGYANGYKPKRLDTPAGTLMVQVPKTAGHDFTRSRWSGGNAPCVPSCWRWPRCT